MGHTTNIKFKGGAKITQQKRISPLQLQKAVDVEIKNSLETGHIKKIDQITVGMFIQPDVISSKNDRRVKIALNARTLNNAFLENKYLMPNLENLTENVVEVVNATEKGEVFCTSLDMQSAYGKAVLHPKTAMDCNSQIVGGESTGTYAFIIGFDGLTIMSPDFQNMIDNILLETKDTFTFIDDILIVTKRTNEEHL